MHYIFPYLFWKSIIFASYILAHSTQIRINGNNLLFFPIVRLAYVCFCCFFVVFIIYLAINEGIIHVDIEINWYRCITGKKQFVARSNTDNDIHLLLLKVCYVWTHISFTYLCWFFYLLLLRGFLGIWIYALLECIWL